MVVRVSGGATVLCLSGPGLPGRESGSGVVARDHGSESDDTESERNEAQEFERDEAREPEPDESQESERGGVVRFSGVGALGRDSGVGVDGSAPRAGVAGPAGALDEAPPLPPATPAWPSGWATVAGREPADDEAPSVDRDAAGSATVDGRAGPPDWERADEEDGPPWCVAAPFGGESAAGAPDALRSPRKCERLGCPLPPALVEAPGRTVRPLSIPDDPWCASREPCATSFEPRAPLE